MCILASKNFTNALGQTLFHMTHFMKDFSNFFFKFLFNKKKKKTVVSKRWRLKRWCLLQKQNTQYSQTRCFNENDQRERERVMYLCVLFDHKWAIAPFVKTTKGCEVKTCNSLTMGKAVKKWVDLCLIFITNFYIER